MKIFSALACASLLTMTMAAPALAGVKVKNGNGGSVNVNRGGVKVQGGGGSKVKVNPGRNGSVNMNGPTAVAAASAGKQLASWVKTEAFAALSWLISNQLEPMAISRLGPSITPTTRNCTIYRSLRASKAMASQR